MIVAGSENVWLNGIRLNRGEENDYTIDYSIGEIFFMPKNIIYFDSDIYLGSKISIIRASGTNVRIRGILWGR